MEIYDIYIKPKPGAEHMKETEHHRARNRADCNVVLSDQLLGNEDADTVEVYKTVDGKPREHVMTKPAAEIRAQIEAG